ncbi:hypothetical protein BV372_07035 [Nostoc sp. T09]|uniref:hypothetical protein n=1 Tax=Nostoc sp. T09 TaxID=1932621 RepID=UPI000A35FC4B|nr:hypothetical protein [Nostoc sp. T09]OUL36514.1 hypothetical protein BV372_07035 [Nostoc sp. T09]
MDSEGKQTFFTPVGEVGGSVGYAGLSVTSNPSQAAKAADKYLKDSLLLNKLTERVYELLLEDLRYQRERFNNYNHQRWL